LLVAAILIGLVLHLLGLDVPIREFFEGLL
jgi:hypothetical protein